MWPSLEKCWKDPSYRAMRRAKRDAALKRIRNGEGFIYLAEVVATDVVKIGFSLNPKARVGALWLSTHGTHAKLLVQVPGTWSEEIVLHRTLRGLSGCLWHEFYRRSILNHPAIPIEFRAHHRESAQPEQEAA